MNKLHDNNQLIRVKQWSNEAGPPWIYQSIDWYEPIFDKTTEKENIDETNWRLSSLKVSRCEGKCCLNYQQLGPYEFLSLTS